MLRHTWKPALALGAVLAAAGAASAGDRDPAQLSGGPAVSTTMTLGGKGTAAQAATRDTELARGYHGGGYHGWHGGYGGYRGYYGGYGGYRGYYGGYSSFYRPYYGGYYGYRPYYAGYYRPYYGYGGYYGVSVYSTYAYPSCGFYLGIAGGAGSGAPVVSSDTNFAPPMPQPTAPGDGTFPYDGGPSAPVPLPKADPGAIPPANPGVTATDLPISGKSRSVITPVVSPYKYKAYGEK